MAEKSHWKPSRNEAKQLRRAGYDGLYYPGECACKVEDLYPCGERQEECRPGVLGPCPMHCGEHDWHIIERSKSGISERTSETPEAGS